jgi:hypothetical protein
VILYTLSVQAKELNCAAETAAKAIFETCESATHLYRTTLSFLAADKSRLQDVDEAA